MSATDMRASQVRSTMRWWNGPRERGSIIGGLVTGLLVADYLDLPKWSLLTYSQVGWPHEGVPCDQQQWLLGTGMHPSI